jgi:hypothetical protein
VRRLLPALACAVFACGDFSLVPRRDAVPSFVQVSAFADHRLTDSHYGVLLSFGPGVDSTTGIPFAIADSSIQIGDSVLTYQRESTYGAQRILEYRWEAVRDSSQPPIETLKIRFPLLAGSVSGIHEVQLALPRRGDPTVLTLVDEVALHVVGYAFDSATADSTASHWLMEIRSQCRNGQTPFVSLSGSTVFPGELRVPRSWFPATMSDSAMACFFSSTLFKARDAAIPTTVFVQGNIEWLLRLP